MGNEENKAPMAEKIDLTPVEVDPSLSDEAEFGKPDNDSKSYGMFLRRFRLLLRCWHSFTSIRRSSEFSRASGRERYTSRSCWY